MSRLAWFNSADTTFATEFHAFMSRRTAEANTDVTLAVRDIIADVRQRGDAALCDYTQRFDAVTITPATMRITETEMRDAHTTCSREVQHALAFAAERITAYHAHQLPKDWSYADVAGNTLGMRWSAVDRAGIYVPGGKASYPSSVLMNALPARAAGVRELCMVVPTPRGELNPALLVAARLCGIDEIYRIGGAHAIAAMALGTDTISQVDAIAGPGNQYVAEAKRQLFGVIGIDMVAGPSEILVIADGSTDAHWVAADMLSQAEHDEMAQSILICTDANYAQQVQDAIEHILKTLPRAEIARTSLKNYGAIIVAETPAVACDIANKIAAEHLELMVQDTAYYLQHIRHAGAIFIGAYTPEAIGDYVAGPSHVLPTTQSARYASGLSVYQFMKKTSLIECSKAGFSALAEAASVLAECEGLGAHQRSVELRRK
jgi:histidinol dehydrogenase